MGDAVHALASHSLPSGLLRTAVRVALAAAVVAPASVVLHELGHLVVGLAMGYPVRLHTTSVSGGPTLGASPSIAVAVQASAGPLITAALMIVAWLVLRRHPASPWGYALGVTAPVRFLVGGVFVTAATTSWLRGHPFTGTPNFDEYNAATALGLSALWIATLQTALLVVFWLWVAKRPPRGRQLMFLASALAGGAAGMTMWTVIVGPALFG